MTPDQDREPGFGEILRMNLGAVELRIVLDEDDIIGEVLGQLKSLDRSVLHLTKMEPTLETVFIHHVGRGLSDEETEPNGG